jgi:hypothetical protein
MFDSIEKTIDQLQEALAGVRPHLIVVSFSDRIRERAGDCTRGGGLGDSAAVASVWTRAPGREGPVSAPRDPLLVKENYDVRAWPHSLCPRSGFLSRQRASLSGYCALLGLSSCQTDLTSDSPARLDLRANGQARSLTTQPTRRLLRRHGIGVAMNLPRRLGTVTVTRAAPAAPVLWWDPADAALVRQRHHTQYNDSGLLRPMARTVAEARALELGRGTTRRTPSLPPSWALPEAISPL